MRRLICVIGMCLLTLTMFGQSTSKYQVATILEVKPHQNSAPGPSDIVSYDVSVKVGDTIYAVLYTPSLGESTIKHLAGRELLILVGKNTITYNDILGRSFEVPIESQRPAKPSQKPE